MHNVEATFILRHNGEWMQKNDHSLDITVWTARVLENRLWLYDAAFIGCRMMMQKYDDESRRERWLTQTLSLPLWLVWFSVLSFPFAFSLPQMVNKVVYGSSVRERTEGSSGLCHFYGLQNDDDVGGGRVQLMIWQTLSHSGRSSNKLN